MDQLSWEHSQGWLDRGRLWSRTEHPHMPLKRKKTVIEAGVVLPVGKSSSEMPTQAERAACTSLGQTSTWLITQLQMVS